MASARKCFASCRWNSPWKPKSSLASAWRAALANPVNRLEATRAPNPSIMSSHILEVKNLHAGVPGKEILKGFNLTVGPGEVHAIMGPNGSGKSTLAHVLAGRDSYEVTAGEIL